MTLSCCVLLLACGARPVAPADDLVDEDTSSTIGVDSPETDTDTDEPDLPGCYEHFCSYKCERYEDECGYPMHGHCAEDDTCECTRDPACLPCAEQQCEPYEQCGFGTSEYGECLLDCYHEFVYSWERELACTIALPQDIPSWVLNSFFLEISGDWIPTTDACDDPEYPDSWVLDQQAFTVTLCGGACTQFETVGELVTGWGFPCE